MYYYKIAAFVFSFLIHICLSVSDRYLEVYLQCNGSTVKEKLFINEHFGKDVPFFKKVSRCTSEIDHVKVIIPESNSIAISKLTSNIVLFIRMSNDKIIGINMVESENVEDSKYLFQRVKITNINAISDVNPEISVTKETESQKMTETQPSFLRKYWWLIAIGFISYSILTTDQRLIEPIEGNLVNEQINEVKTNRRIHKKKV
ncbi:uncharacterized protein cubi_01858 [Cryptosporidium ubiquitum]|uniref:ER membrane protein complex subunit 10 n=1 Tax=Cryptosporidium ubiquitum TaxID=857276 RepID=A0A1J4MM64_9CRYT|nr:uncharacterized protein cubi_01858 [Cryptosporidium ubiquitum]OII75337.1 hypothetical protein cubi_01858 [Cryptosporidium ubiquitum]